jgi:hypothetical protein
MTVETEWLGWVVEMGKTWNGWSNRADLARRIRRGGDGVGRLVDTDGREMKWYV